MSQDTDDRGHARQRWNDVAEAFSGPADPGWEADMALVDGPPTDPWLEK